jgi:hypothetical protein
LKNKLISKLNSKKKDWQDGLKLKTQGFVDYKKIISPTVTNIDLELKNIFQANGPSKQGPLLYLYQIR